MYLSEKDVKEIFDVINKRFEHVTVLVETMNPAMVKHMKEKSIEAAKPNSHGASRTAKSFAKLIPNFRFIEEHSLAEEWRSLSQYSSFLKDKACEQYLKQDSSNGKITLTSHPHHAIIPNLEVPPRKSPSNSVSPPQFRYNFLSPTI